MKRLTILLSHSILPQANYTTDAKEQTAGITRLFKIQIYRAVTFRKLTLNLQEKKSKYRTALSKPFHY